MLRIGYATKGPEPEQQGMEESIEEEGARIQHRIMLLFSKKMDFLVPYPLSYVLSGF